MTSKHSTPEWRRTVRIVRAQARATWARGDEVLCWRCGRPIDDEARIYDVGHIDPLGGEGIDNAAPEHRKENRRHGGRIGARLTNARHGSTFTPPPWIA
jgi:hypothetical protein